jgi:dolichyl-phosphate-mannose-protein mannosyltransferase
MMKRPAIWLRAAMKSLRADAPLAVLLAAMVVLGVFLRLHAIRVPAALKWDEHHYVNVARSYVGHQYATDDHPPLGKLIIAGVMAFLGDTPLGWRLGPLLFGFINVGLAAWAARTVFASRRAAFIAAAFVAADGFFIAYSRAALLDGMIVAFGLAGITAMLAARKWWHVLCAGLLVGAAASFKLNGVTFVVAATVLCLASRRLRRFAPLLVLEAAVVFYLQSAFALVFTGRSGTVAAVIAENRKLIKHHLSYTVVHPFSSHWYTWFLPLRPIYLRRDVDPLDHGVRALLTLGNPLLWWASTLAVVAAAAVVIKVGPRRLWEQLQALGTRRSNAGGPADAAVAEAGTAAVVATDPEPAVTVAIAVGTTDVADAGRRESGTGPAEAGATETPAAPATTVAPAARVGGGAVFGLQERAGLLCGMLIAWAGPLAFWVPSLRDAYIYHYLPSYTFALILLAGFADRFYDRRRLVTFIAIVIVAEVSIFYAPLWGELPIAEDALNVRLFPAWR